MTLPDFLTQDPDGEIHMTGHRIGLYTVMRHYKEGCSADLEELRRRWQAKGLGPLP